MTSTNRMNIQIVFILFVFNLRLAVERSLSLTAGELVLCLPPKLVYNKYSNYLLPGIQHNKTVECSGVFFAPI